MGKPRRSRRKPRPDPRLYDAETRAYIARRARQGAHPKEIAREIDQPVRVVEESMSRSLARVNRPRPEQDERTTTVTGEVLDSPEERAFVLQVFALRKKAWPYDKISELTGRTERECQQAVSKRLKELDGDELADATAARRIMLEQLDSMIRAVSARATGEDDFGDAVPVEYDAMDRMMRLLDQKARLLGLNQVQRIDLHIRIEELARRSGYDVKELQDIAQEVLQDFRP